MPDPDSTTGLLIYAPLAVVVAIAGAFGYYRKKKANRS